MGKMLFKDISEAVPSSQVNKGNTPKLPDDFGRELETAERARKWLTNPHNWHEGNIFVIKWNGLLCSVSRSHGMRLIDEPWDNGLPEVVAREQIRLRRGGKNNDEIISVEE